jgi:hypothetical protein
MEQQVAIIEAGKDPMNVFRDAAKNVYLDLPTEENFLAGTAGYRPGRPRTGASSKYSPIMDRWERVAAEDRE